MSDIRISAASIARIALDDKFLVGLNKSRLRKANRRVYTPFGGALEFYDSARDYLSGLGMQFEKGNDLRGMLPEEKLTEFESWFLQRKDRETSPYRELREELVDEEEILASLPENAANVKYLGTARQRAITDKPGVQNVLTQRYLEVYGVSFSNSCQAQIRSNIQLPETHLALVSSEDIQRGTYQNSEIGDVCMALFLKDF